MIQENEWVRTNEFRFVKSARLEEHSRDEKKGLAYFQCENKIVLQQKFELRPIKVEGRVMDLIADRAPIETEWRDVPITEDY